ncbi:DUF1835 domain-containing protein [Streptomyces sp. RS10V-4]|uniref:DUF1835 domain-containing protein n=1 Tax=Streptomyces rhizoryzae TaxID=2932493 RepID=UPI002003EA27|nr:DUF1835 domain-containing protein [Streptomyces rhizoryzae]MCK7625189.1 DUF1835 domain-containing protein [Streptomyces rhizoryzae]
MSVLHVVPGVSAAGSLRVALRLGEDAGARVLAFPDDLSWGPIASADPAGRRQWWETLLAMTGWPDVGDDDGGAEFWHALDAADDRIVVWFGSHSASESAFFLAVAERLGERPFDIVEVAYPPVPAVSALDPNELKSRLETAQPCNEERRASSRQRWQRLREEDAVFRVVTAAGLASAPAQHFDAQLLQAASPGWQPIHRVVGDVMSENNVADLPLFWRVATLVETGKLSADGDPWAVRASNVRLPA